jgi:hypothetical protein
MGGGDRQRRTNSTLATSGLLPMFFAAGHFVWLTPVLFLPQKNVH